MSQKLISLDVASMPFRDAYRLMIGAIVPRPIAWVSTMSPSGLTNLAPFSFFNGVCSNPPVLSFSCTVQRDGREKDTLRNIRATGEFVVNLASEALGAKMDETGEEFPPEVSEFQAVGVTPAPSTKVKPPRVADSPLSLECVLHDLVPVGNGGPGSATLVLGRIVSAQVEQSAWNQGKILVERLAPLARLGGPYYCPVRDVFEY